MDKRISISMRSSRNLAAISEFLHLQSGDKLLWKTSSDLLLVRYIYFMDKFYKWTVLASVELNAGNCTELKNELKFFEVLANMNDTFCKSQQITQSYFRIHSTTRRIVIGTMKSILQLVEELQRIRCYRLSNSQ